VTPLLLIIVSICVWQWLCVMANMSRQKWPCCYLAKVVDTARHQFALKAAATIYDWYWPSTLHLCVQLLRKFTAVWCNAYLVEHAMNNENSSVETTAKIWLTLILTVSWSIGSWALKIFWHSWFGLSTSYPQVLSYVSKINITYNQQTQKHKKTDVFLLISEIGDRLWQVNYFRI